MEKVEAKILPIQAPAETSRVHLKVEKVDLSGAEQVLAAAPAESLEKADSARVTAKQTAEETISTQALQELVEVLREKLPVKDLQLNFSVDTVLNRPVMSVHDKKTGELVRQVPAQEVLRAVHNIDYMRGVLFDDIG